jgi:anti-sigma B factor antagonist
VARVDATDRLTIGESGDGPVPVAGELDAYTAPTLEGFLEERIGRGEGAVRLDLAGVTFMDSSGVRVIVNADNMLRSSGKELVILDPSPVVSRLFELTSLDDRLTIERS